MKKRIFIVVLVILLCLPVLSLSACGKKIKDIEPYRAEFERLIKESFAINEIFYGEGLPVYSRDDGIGEMYYTEEKTAEYLAYFRENAGKDYPESHFTEYGSKFRLYYWVFEDENYKDPYLSGGEIPVIVKYRMISYQIEKDENGGETNRTKVTVCYAQKKAEKDDRYGKEVYIAEDGAYYYPISDYKEPEVEYVYSPSDNEYYDVVRFDSEYTSIESIKEAAERVYSKDYLEGVYSAIFDGARSDFGEEDGQGAVLYPRYIVETNAEGDSLLKKCNLSPALFTEIREYDYASMRIVKPYGKTSVNVEIDAYGEYLNSDLDVVVGKHTVRLSFVLENGIWRLDSPTY